MLIGVADVDLHHHVRRERVAGETPVEQHLVLRSAGHALDSPHHRLAVSERQRRTGKAQRDLDLGIAVRHDHDARSLFRRAARCEPNLFRKVEKTNDIRWIHAYATMRIRCPAHRCTHAECF